MNLYYQHVKRPSKCPCGSNLPCASIGIYIYGKYRKHGNACPACLPGCKLNTVCKAILSRPGCTPWPDLETAFR